MPTGSTNHVNYGNHLGGFDAESQFAGRFSPIPYLSSLDLLIQARHSHVSPFFLPLRDLSITLSKHGNLPSPISHWCDLLI